MIVVNLNNQSVSLSRLQEFKINTPFSIEGADADFAELIRFHSKRGKFRLGMFFVALEKLSKKQGVSIGEILQPLLDTGSIEPIADVVSGVSSDESSFAIYTYGAV